DREEGFDLTRGPLIRFFLCRLQADHFIMVWSFHHILMDGWCFGILLEDWLDYYRQLLGQPSVTIQPAVPYSDYIRWLAKQDQHEALNYWRNYLNGYDEPSSLLSNSGKQSHQHHQTQIFQFSADETQRMVD